MATLYAAAFRGSRPWRAQEFRDLCASPHVQAFTRPYGFALTRSIAGESELLTLAVHPDHHRTGIARALLRDWLETVAPLADTAFLEVAADNSPARALYAQLGFTQTATRRGYYARQGGAAVDAFILTRAFVGR